MNRNTKVLIAGGLILTGGFLIFMNYQRSKQREEYARLLRKLKQRSGYAEPPRNSPEWQQWIQYAIGAYGFSQTLWEPGGIFYGSSLPNITDKSFWQNLFNKDPNWSQILTNYNFLP